MLPFLFLFTFLLTICFVSPSALNTAVNKAFIPGTAKTVQNPGFGIPSKHRQTNLVEPSFNKISFSGSFKT